MAESMCGPSNALQNFQKHSTVDRTLQQDRLIHRPSPSQGFRSSPGPNVRLANYDFEAFQAGHIPNDPFNPQPSSIAHPPQIHQPALSASWASDFQRLNISTPSPQLRQSFTPQRQEPGGWHQEFARQQSQISTPSQQSTPFQNYSPMNRLSLNYSTQSYTPQSQSSIAQQKQPEQFDDEAFARAFEAAARNEIMAQERQQSEMGHGVKEEQGMELGQEAMIEESAAHLLSPDSETLPRIGADQIHDPSTPQNAPRPEDTDPDALARTAGQLLNSVRHDQSTKFQKSQFLQLMRQVRDREVMVAGDKFVGTGDREVDAETAVGDAKAKEWGNGQVPPAEEFVLHG